MKPMELMLPSGTSVGASERAAAPTQPETVTDIAATDIAVVGRALRVPGARTVGEFWANLRDGVESVRRLSDAELRAAGVDSGLMADPNYIRVGAPLEDMELFDSGFFGFSPREAAIMDPQHRHFLEVAWEALEDAGHVPERFSGRIGIFGGSGMNAYMPYHLFTNPKLMSAAGLFLIRHTGNDKDFLTTRVSYLFDLRGPSVNIQTACSTSLVAIHSACQSLINQECDMALAGGVTIELPHGHGYLYQEGEILSDDGHCRAFDRKAKGTIFGSGVGLVVLRRLEDALAAGDTVYAVIKASAVNNDGGRKVGYLAPSVDGQAEAVAEALNLSGVPADSISYIECHGTGTPVGDPIEIAGLTHAFRSLTDRKGFCAVGSAKTNIGHLDTAAGVAGFIKVVEMLRHQSLVPNLHFQEPNPEVDWPNTPFYVSERTTPWQSETGEPLRASVNSLGVGGTNAHVVLEEARSIPSARAGRATTVLVLSARSKASLDRATSRLADHLERTPDLLLNDVAHTLAVGRRRFQERRAIVAASTEDAIVALRAGGAPRWLGAPTLQQGAKVAFLFPGGGAQYPAMGADLYASEPVFRARVDTCLDLLKTQQGIDVRGVMFPEPGAHEAAAAALVRPSLALPALLTVELAVAELLKSWGLTPAAMLGHSMGEYAAAFLAGVFSLRDVLAVAACRGRLFETLPDGAMLSVPLPESEVLPELAAGLSFAASNGPGLSLVSGEVAAIAELEARLKAKGVEARRLAITVAAHSQMLDPILSEFEAYLRTLRLSEPTLPFVSNVTGTWIRPEEARDPRYWVRHLRQPVRFAEGLSTLASEAAYAFLEVGPGRTLTSLAQAHPAVGVKRTTVQSLRHPHDAVSDTAVLFGAVGRLWAAGIEPDWKAFLGNGRRRVSLPTYAFDHERHWIEPGNGFFMRREPTQALDKHEDRSQWTYRPVWRESVRPDAPRPGARTMLVFEDEGGVGRELALEFRAAGHTVVSVKAGDGFSRLSPSVFQVRRDSREDHGALLRELNAAGQSPAQVVHLWAIGPESSASEDGDGAPYFYPFVALGQALIDEEPSGALDLVVVTSGAEAAGSETAPASPLKALSQGAVRVLPREMPSIACRSIDLPAVYGSAQAVARMLMAEIDAETIDTRVALRGDDRFVEVYERWPLADPVGSWPLPERAVVLMTGGLGGICLSLAERMAQVSRARLVLVSRTALPARDQWATLLAELDPSDPLLARVRSIQRIEAAGGEVFVVAADVADRAVMRQVVAAAEKRFGPITTAIHAAGVIDDAPLHSKNRESLQAVLRPKVTGAIALVEALRGRRLESLTFFSSSSATLGPAGQTDYVAANAFLNAYARQLAGEGIPARAVQWGAWQEVGMAVAALTPPVPTGSSERVDHPLLQRRSNVDGSTRFHATLDARTHWVLDDHRVRGAEPVMPGTGFVEMARAALFASGTAPAGSAVELSDLSFTSPLIVPEKAPAVVETEVRRDSDDVVAITVRSSSRRGPQVEHTTGRGRVLHEWAPARIDVAAIEKRCTLRRESFGPGEQQLPQERLLAFGTRWKAVRSIAFGKAEALARLELLEGHAADLQTFALHPGLLDMATGCAFSLIDGPGSDSLVVPLSYGRVRIVQRLPRVLVSHVRLRPGSSGGVSVLDATLADERGQVVAEIEGYLVKAVDPRVLKTGRKSESRSPLERWVEQGILPDEGFDVLGRILGQTHEVQVLVSPLDLHAMIAELRPPERVAAPAAASAGAQQPGAQPDGPRDEIEQRLAGVWSELLGVERVGLHDAFFDLGGHSLIAVRLFARIRKMWGVDLPLATLFGAPTLEALAAAVRTRLGLTLEVGGGTGAAPAAALAPVGWSPIVLIKKGGSRQPFFCVHGAGGNLLNFRDFSERLSPEQPVYGLEARGVDGQLPPAQSIEEMAELYLEALRRQQATGPYLLGGYSGGGVVALEMAQRLVAAGERVNEVVLLDTFHPGTSGRDVSWRDHFDGMVGEGWPYLRRHLEFQVQRYFVWARQDRRLRRHLGRGEAVPHELREWHLATTFLEALKKYVPAPYQGRVTLFRAQEVARAYDHVGARLGWSDTLLPKLELFEVPGGHDSLVREPNVRVLASGLDEVLRRDGGDPQAGEPNVQKQIGDRKVTVGV
jgi:acyl transferase domain-containing protein/thioesterase domain-containing protein